MTLETLLTGESGDVEARGDVEGAEGRGKTVVCLSSPGYQDRVVDNYRRIVELSAIGAHFDGGYGGTPPVCYDARHGHPAGPGKWTVQGYRDV